MDGVLDVEVFGIVVDEIVVYEDVYDIVDEGDFFVEIDGFCICLLFFKFIEMCVYVFFVLIELFISRGYVFLLFFYYVIFCILCFGFECFVRVLYFISLLGEIFLKFFKLLWEGEIVEDVEYIDVVEGWERVLVVLVGGVGGEGGFVGEVSIRCVWGVIVEEVGGFIRWGVEGGVVDVGGIYRIWVC